VKRHWLVEDLHGGRQSNGQPFFDESRGERAWSPLMLKNANPLRIEFETHESGLTPDCYYLDAFGALTTLDRLRKLIPVGEFRIHNVTTGEIIRAEALAGVLSR
jgi:hypothetical protein